MGPFVSQNNILISNLGSALIADFGLSHEVAKDMKGYSTEWYDSGNPRWKAPEILQAETLDDALRTTMSDIYSFGRVIYEVISPIPRAFSALSM